MSDYQPHPAAELFPMMPDDQYQAFKRDVKENGFQQSITLYKGQILDGRNRHKAAIELKMLDELPIAEIDDDTDFDPYQWVISRNLHRRHLNESQRAKIAAKLAKLKHGHVASQKSDGQICLSTKQVAEMLQVSPTSVKNAKIVEEHGSPELNEAVERGEVAVSKAAKIARETPKEQQAKKAKEKSSKKKGKNTANQTEPDVDQEAVEGFLRCRSPLNRLKKLVAELTDQQKTMLREWLA